jgi:hypothetical protein
MTTPIEKKPSWWAIFLGRSPPMPPIPPGGWTPESVRDYWRQRIATSPQDAPLSHAALAELLRTRDTFRNWFIWRKPPGWLEPFALEETFIQRAYAIPALCFFLVLAITYMLFTLFPWMRTLYPLAILSQDTLCVDGGSIFTRRPYRCDNAVGAVDIAFLSSVFCLATIVLLFLKQGGASIFRYSQKTKIYIANGGVISAFLVSSLTFILAAWALKFYVIDQDLLPYILFISIPLLLLCVVMLLQAVWLTFRAGYAMIFFYMTGRFPLWLEDLSP